ncbi:TPA: hypothetical protein CPT88_09100 [Candidatus Gastranaerophilales bacterium HUM_8]|jgi:hypothetical protein|nr:MAG TPA: hypothetical protein CPT88_09100 [Candidatus Gastranaerophilales bacterium HUM_8]DAB03048.1 MAG TPA: hypothetical protein CPT89_04105 [Candidatus Gastranaerophilales bacterium HUM_11]
MNSYGKDNVIAKALFNKVISEDVAEKLTVDELLCLNRLMFICDNFSIESLLRNYISDFDLSSDYRSYIANKNKEEVLFKKNIDEVLQASLLIIPDPISNLISTFLADILYQDYKTLENPLIKTNTIKYVKRKYSCYQDYYYVDLIMNFTNSVPIGLLYIIYDS